MKLVIIVAFLVAYIPPALSAQWVYEDGETMPAAGPLQIGPRFITNWSLRLTPTPATVRLGNMALHAGVAALVSTLTPLWPVVLLHAMAVETVMYASGRAELISALGIVLTCIGVVKWGVVAIIPGMALALGGKESGAIVLILAIVAMWHFRAYRIWLVTLCAGLIALGIYSHGMTIINADVTAGWTSNVFWYEWAPAQGGAISYWLASIMWPSLLTPDADIDRLSAAARCLGLITVATSGVAAWTYRSFGLAWFAVSLVPRLIVQTPGGYLNAHQFYVPFIGLTIAAGEIWTKVRERYEYAVR